jgi:hypothetical protein
VKYHCYIEYREAVYTADVEAVTPERAAEFAADRCHINGEWTVVPGEPVYVTIREHSTYEAVKSRGTAEPG